MILGGFRTVQEDGWCEFRATVEWEDRTRDAVEVFMAVTTEDAGRATLNPDAFRIPTAVVARHDGEHRISGGGPMCPILRHGMSDALGWLAHWANSSANLPAIDLPSACNHPNARDQGVSAAFVSGGVDSLALLTANHASHPPGDGRRVSLAIVVVGIQRYRWKSTKSIVEQLEAAREQLTPVAEEFEMDIIPVATNLRVLNPSTRFWQDEFQGAVLAGIGHLFSGSVANVAIASTWQIPYLDNWGSHPLLDNNYSSHSLTISHELAHLSRVDKVRVIATRPALLDQLNVCNAAEGGDENCGRCEKCLRTMLAFEALGLLGDTTAFSLGRVEAEQLDRMRTSDRGLERKYAELVEPLRLGGRPDLAAKVQRRIVVSKFRRRSRSVAGRIARRLRLR